MTRDMIEIEGGDVLANFDDRTLTGLLIPYGERGRTNVGEFEVEAGVIRLPADPVVVGLNTDHDRYAPVGRAAKVWEEARGVMATFEVARTPEGDAALEDARSGKRAKLSGEFRTGIKAGKATGGHLSGAALVERGAFASAGVLAADMPFDDEDETESTTPDDADPEASTTRDVQEFTDENGVTWRSVAETTTETEAVEDGTETTITTTITETETETETEESEVTANAVPTTQRPAARATTADRPHDLPAILAAMADVKSNPNSPDAVEVLAALSDIKMTGTGALPTGGSAIRENWVGQIYQGIPYVREYVNLLTLGTSITAGGKKGYTLDRGTSASPVENFDGTWAGNKAAIPSGGGFTASKASELFRFAFGVDIAREFYDLPGGSEVVEAFVRLIAEDHLVWSDEIARTSIVTAAGAPVAPKTYPGVDGHDYAGALGQLIQGVLAVKSKKADGRRDVPTFAMVNEAAYEELVYTPKDLIPEFITFTVGTDGEGTADGVRVVQGDTGVADSASVIVGSGRAIELDELPGGPLHIDALDLARGGIDKAIHGYLQRFVVRPEAIVHVGVADAAV